MSSGYPGALDNFATNRAVGQGDPAADYNNVADAVNKIEAELGTDPAGSFSTVRDRLDAFMNGWPPSSPNAADDEFNQADGTNPTTVGWTWANQAGVTAEIRDGRLAFNLAGSSARSFHVLTKPFPAGTSDVTVVARVNGSWSDNHHGIGIVLIWGTLATPTKVEAIYSRNDHATPDWNGYANLALGSPSARKGGTAGLYPVVGGAVGFKYVHSGTTVQGLISRDPRSPEDFSPYGTATNAASARPDFYGIGVSDETTNPAGRQIPLWAEYFRVDWATI